MKSIRLNNQLRDDILQQIRIHVDKKYEKNKITLEFEETKTKFINELISTIISTYGKDVGVLHKWNLTEKINSFYLRFNGDESISFNSSKPFHYNKGWIFFEFNKNVYVPISSDPRYTQSYRAKNTIIYLIETTSNLIESFKWISQMACDIETEKNTILKAYNDILSKHNTTKKLLENYPSMKQFVEFLNKEKKLEPSEIEKIIEKFETEE
jgi:hypothetical protein